MYKLKGIAYTLYKIINSVLKSLGRKILLICAAVMIGLSNAIYEEDKMIDLDKGRTEQHEDDRKNKPL